MPRLSPHVPSPCVLILATVLAGATTGCFQRPPILPEELQRGYILLLPGTENTISSMAGIVQGLRDAGVKQAIDLDPWGHCPFGTFRNLHTLELNRQRAADRAAKLIDYRRAHPDTPLTIIGWSAGGAIALFVAEALPDDVQLDRMILLAPAVAPRYDPAPAAARCRDGIICFYSERDWFMLGLGTLLFGTVDRVNTSAAGRLGFKDADGQPLGGVGLAQMSWDPAWAKLGNHGGHRGWLSRTWVGEVLAPLVDPTLDEAHASASSR